MRIVNLFGIGLFVASSAAMASGLEFQLGNHTAQVEGYLSSMSPIVNSGSEFNLGGFVNSRNDFIGNVGFSVQGLAAGESPLSFGLGVNAYAGTVKAPGVNVAAIAIGGLIKYTIPYRMPMSIKLQGYYAPDITSFSQSKNFTDVSLDYGIEVTPGATAYVGYRILESHLKRYGEYRFDNALHVGIRLHF